MGKDSYSIKISWTVNANLPSEEVALVIPGGDLGFSDWSDPPMFDYLTWSGSRERLFKIEYIGNLELEFPTILHISPAANRYFAFALSDSIYLAEIYWIDIQTRNLFGFDPPCQSITTVGEDSIAIGPEWLAYVCDEDQTTWHAFSLADPSITISIHLPFEEEFSKGFEPFWLDSDTLVLDRLRSSDTRCIVDISDVSEPIVSCETFDLTLGRFSTDRNRMEVRVSYDTTDAKPEEIGVLNTACFSTPIRCTPDFFFSPFSPGQGSLFLQDTTWLPDGTGILYLQFEEMTVNTVFDRDTRLWIFDLQQESFSQIADLEPPLLFNHYSNHSDAIWSADGNRVLLQNALSIYAFDLTDGTLLMLNDDGGIAIGTVLLP